MENKHRHKYGHLASTPGFQTRGGIGDIADTGTQYNMYQVYPWYETAGTIQPSSSYTCKRYRYYYRPRGSSAKVACKHGVYCQSMSLRPFFKPPLAPAWEASKHANYLELRSAVLPPLISPSSAPWVGLPHVRNLTHRIDITSLDITPPPPRNFRPVIDI